MQTKNQAGGRYHSIDFVRGICIIFVIVSHYSWEAVETKRLLFPFWIDMAVPVFMVISGFCYTNSFQKHKISSIGQAYEVDAFLGKVIRYTVPYVIAFCVEEIAFKVTGIFDHSIIDVFQLFLTGGTGSGSYYYPIMIQFVFYFPIIYAIIRKYDFNGVIICGFINFMYELLRRAYTMNVGCYRLLVFRYTLIIAFGCYYAMGNHKRHKMLSAVSFCIGVSYILVTRFIGISPPITNLWTGTSLWACLYLIPFIGPVITSGISNRFFELLGKASFNIYLAHMVTDNWVSLLHKLPTRALQLTTNIVMCIALGVAFYYIEQPITEAVHNKAYKMWDAYKYNKQQN